MKTYHFEHKNKESKYEYKKDSSKQWNQASNEVNIDSEGARKNREYNENDIKQAKKHLLQLKDDVDRIRREKIDFEARVFTQPRIHPAAIELKQEKVQQLLCTKSDNSKVFYDTQERTAELNKMMESIEQNKKVLLDLQDSGTQFECARILQQLDELCKRYETLVVTYQELQHEKTSLLHGINENKARVDYFELLVENEIEKIKKEEKSTEISIKSQSEYYELVDKLAILQNTKTELEKEKAELLETVKVEERKLGLNEADLDRYRVHKAQLEEVKSEKDLNKQNKLEEIEKAQSENEEYRNKAKNIINNINEIKAELKHRDLHIHTANEALEAILKICRESIELISSSRSTILNKYNEATSAIESESQLLNSLKRLLTVTLEQEQVANEYLDIQKEHLSTEGNKLNALYEYVGTRSNNLLMVARSSKQVLNMPCNIAHRSNKPFSKKYSLIPSNVEANPTSISYTVSGKTKTHKWNDLKIVRFGVNTGDVLLPPWLIVILILESPITLLLNNENDVVDLLLYIRTYKTYKTSIPKNTHAIKIRSAKIKVNFDLFKKQLTVTDLLNTTLYSI